MSAISRSPACSRSAIAPEVARAASDSEVIRNGACSARKLRTPCAWNACVGTSPRSTSPERTARIALASTLPLGVARANRAGQWTIEMRVDPCESASTRRA